MVRPRYLSAEDIEGLLNETEREYSIDFCSSRDDNPKSDCIM